jgi:uncharacterized protein YdaU (DUF1376 family)
MKIRRIDFSPDEFIAGTMELSDAECGLYWRLCSLIYSRGRSVSRDELRAVTPSHGNTFNALLRRLIATGKVIANDADLIVKRCANELEKAGKRIANLRENGAKGGRPTSKSNGIAKPTGLFPPRADVRAEPSTTNHQHIKERESKLSLKKDAPPDLAAEFNRFWSLYPRRIDKAGARTAYRAARNKTDAEAIEAAVLRYAAERTGQDPKFTKHARTWLAHECWTDEPDPNFEGKPNGKHRFDRQAEWDRRHQHALDILAQAAIDHDERQDNRSDFKTTR